MASSVLPSSSRSASGRPVEAEQILVMHCLKEDSVLGAEGFSVRAASTPDRNLLRVGTHDGPPANPAHVREWSFAEFHAYIAQSFRIEEHFISCAAQGTQCLLCTPIDDATRPRDWPTRDDSR